MSNKNNSDKDWIDDILDRHYWVEVLSGWLTAVFLFGGFYLLFRDENSRYGWLLLYSSFVSGFILLFYKHITLLIVWLVIWIKVKQGKMEFADPIGDAVRDHLRAKRKSK